MRTHYTGPTVAFYRCEPHASRLWWAAHRNLLDVHHQAVAAFTARHQDLLGQGAYLWDSIVHGFVIAAPARPAGCRPHTHRIDLPHGDQAWLPDRRTRTGQMLASQIAGLPRFDSQVITAAAPMPGAMPWTRRTPEGTMLPFRVVEDGVIHLSWPVPIPGLETSVWERTDRSVYLDALAQERHRERVRGLEVIHARLAHRTTGHPDLVDRLHQTVATVLQGHRDDHARVEITSDLVLRSEHLLVEHHHLGQPGEKEVRARVGAALLHLAA